MVDQRRFSRVPFRESVVFAEKGRDERAQGETRDICLGGMFVETATPAAFGAELVAHLHIPGEPQAFQLPGIVRWVGDGGMGLQFGNLGARETYSITAIVAEAQKQ